MGMAVDGDGNLWVADTYNDRIQVFNENGDFLFLFGVTGKEIGKFVSPQDIKISDNGVVYVADTGNGRVQRIQFMDN